MVSLSGFRARAEHVGTISDSSVIYAVILFLLRRSISQWFSRLKRNLAFHTKDNLNSCRFCTPPLPVVCSLLSIVMHPTHCDFLHKATPFESIRRFMKGYASFCAEVFSNLIRPSFWVSTPWSRHFSSDYKPFQVVLQYRQSIAGLFLEQMADKRIDSHYYPTAEQMPPLPLYIHSFIVHYSNHILH